ncbi:TIR domain-containing protein [Catenuloplanes japonicus]|uniref:TIR domain-containing protein n=1 Tax=Catenuloplanes japonicus TaxID=33876 RepID=UPI00052733BB|nr:TIR domain-containing protein [Catenuloplanes japonicus]
MATFRRLPVDALPPEPESGLALHTVRDLQYREWSRLGWSCDGRLLSAIGQDLGLCLWLVPATLGPESHVAERPVGRQTLLRAYHWSPTAEREMAVVSSGRVIMLDVRTNRERWDLPLPDRDVHHAVTISPDGRQVAVTAGGAVTMVDSANGRKRRSFRVSAHTEGLAWSPRPTRELLTRHHEGPGELLLLDGSGQQVVRAGRIAAMAWMPNGVEVCLAMDAAIGIHDIRTGTLTMRAEGHTAPVTGLAVSADGGLLASESEDGELRLWRTDSMECLAVLDLHGGGEEPSEGLAFHPARPLLAFRSHRNRRLHLLECDVERLYDAPRQDSSRYRNAKVVLLGDTGVGKSGLGLVLSGQTYRATDSTHGRQVWRFSEQTVTLPDGGTETREVLLWDLAGQPGYRLVHQLHLAEAAVALIVFDSRSEVDPFSGVRYWVRALRHGRRPVHTLLVSAREDRGGPQVSRKRIEELVAELRLDGYAETSARELRGIKDLTAVIRNAINWSASPQSISTRLFETIKRFLIDEKADGRALTRADDLFRLFQARHPHLEGEPELRAGFDTCVGLLQSRDLIRRFTFGGYVLLCPELLDAYASALINAARAQPEGLGYLAEEEVLAGRFPIPQETRLPDEERLLLIAMVEELLQHDLALREPTDGGVDLVFPSQLTRDRPDAPDLGPTDVEFLFEGALQNVYATLAVRLSHAATFVGHELWRGAAAYVTRAGHRCGFRLTEPEEGVGRLELCYAPGTAEETRLIFEDYVADHLAKRALPDTVVRRRVFTCPRPECGYQLDEDLARRRLARGDAGMECPACSEAQISLRDRDRPVPAVAEEVSAMNASADLRRRRETATATVRGKRAVGDFDVFLAYRTADRVTAERLRQQLLDEGLLPWMHDEEPEADPAELARIDVVVVVVGENGGPWDDELQHAMINDFITRRVRFVPVVLPVKEEPELPGFLRDVPVVDFRVTEPDPVRRLIRRITRAH